MISGKVVGGVRVGRKLGFPTANLDRREYKKKKLRIPFGVYAGTATIWGVRKIYRAGIVIGPMDNRGLPKIEAHLLDFSGFLYGKKVQLSLMHYLRAYTFFKSEQKLKKQISSDIKKIRGAVSL